ncbi:MAG: hypothetical protein Q7S19_00850 [bacterium]|nr:hypothetical protein [bacterium]
MKGCIILQRQFALMGNAIALELKNNYGVKEFCGYIHTRRAEQFVKNQKDINYSSLILDEELHAQYKNEELDLEYIKKIEEEYGLPSLWPYLILDRSLMMEPEYDISPTPPFTHEELLRILQVKFREIKKFLEREKPDFVVGVNIGSLGNFVFYNVAKKMGIKTYALESGRIRNLIAFTDDDKILSGVEIIFKKIKEEGYQSPFKKTAEDFLSEFRAHPAPPEYAKEEEPASRKSQILALPKKLFTGLKFTTKSIFDYYNNPYRTDLTVENPIQVLKDKIVRRLRMRRNMNKFYDKVDFGEDFAFFPLHFEPEIATLLYAPFYANQLNLISQIAKSLPIGFKLYVKEHPAMLEYRPTEYYKEMKKIPNVKLVPTSTSSFDLMKHGKLMTVITGTVGLEATFLRKPVITFGEVFFNKLSMIKRCGAIENLPALIKDRLHNYRYDDQEVLDFVTAIFEDSVPFDFMGLWVKGGSYETIKSDKMFPAFVASLTKKIGLKPTTNTSKQ